MIERAGAQLQPAGDQLSIYYATLLDSLADGVLSISPEHRVEVVNATGAAVLGCDPRTIIGTTLAEAFLIDEANDAFMDAILAAASGTAGTVKTVVAYNRGGTERRLAVASTAYRVHTGPSAGKFGVVVTFNDVTEMLRLQVAEQELEQELSKEHLKLQSAYTKLEDAARRDHEAARRTSFIRMIAAIMIAAIFAAVGLYNWWSVLPTQLAESSSAAQGTDRFAVHARPVSTRVSVVGAIDAGSIVSVVAPFDGPVKSKQFEYGGPVERGQPLLKLDGADTQVRLREAESVMIKARQRLIELQTWESGIEVSRSRRSVTSAEVERGNLLGRLAQTKGLFSKGIVPAEELKLLQQQQYSQEVQLDALRQDLQATIDRGNEENRRIAEYELLNAQAKMDELKNDLARSTVEAPVSGVVLQPVEADGKAPQMVVVGSRVVRGQNMFSIGDLESFSVKAKIDEVDINKVRISQKAIVTGDAFDGMTLDGTVISVAAQASSDAATRQGGMATFPIIIKIPNLTPEQRTKVHVGMSASLTIIIYDNPDAIVVPANAVKMVNGKNLVRVMRNGQPDDVIVILGTTTPEGVEVRQGLSDGDLVEVTN